VSEPWVYVVALVAAFAIAAVASPVGVSGAVLALGIGGLVGSYTGPRLQPHLPETTVRRLLGILVLTIGVHYAWLAISG